MVDQLLDSDEKAPGRLGGLQTRSRAWGRLVATVEELKNSTQDLAQLHQYQTILASIAPDCDAPVWELGAVAKRLDLKSTKGLESAATRREKFFKDDATEEHSWLYEPSRASARSLMAAHADHHATVLKFWSEHTSQSSHVVSHEHS